MKSKFVFIFLAVGGKVRNKKLDVLRNINFGERVAEDERAQLAEYFVETDQWRKLLKDEIDIIFGAKGTGKSALFCLLFEKDVSLSIPTLCIAADNMKGTTIFKSLEGDTLPTENTLVYLWKLYMIALLVNEIDKKGLHTTETLALRDALGTAGLLPKRFSIHTVFRLIKDFALRVLEGEASSIEHTLSIDPSSGLPTAFTRKANYERSERGSDIQLWVNEYLSIIDNALEHHKVRSWIAFDRLDVAFTESLDLEKNAIRALFKTYNDMKSFDNIGMKIFVRDDIWRRIWGGRFSEASHIIKESQISWDRNGLINLIFKRTVKNQTILDFLNVSDDVTNISIHEQEAFLNRILPEKINSGKNPSTIDWVFSRVKDGLGVVAPREVIHMLECAKEIQIKRLERNEIEPANDMLFERSVFKEAVHIVSKSKYEKTLCAEYPHLVTFMEKLRGGKTEYTLETLSIIWGVDIEEAKYKSEDLCGIGFFEKGKYKFDKSVTSYRIPMLYHSALESIRGSAVVIKPRGNSNSKSDSYSSLILKALTYLKEHGVESANGAEITRVINNNFISRDMKKKEPTNVSRALRSRPLINQTWLKRVDSDGNGLRFSLSDDYLISSAYSEK
ncbi:P-loop ATPase, Sll1717 family [Aeromonas sp. S11(2024)]|uniref:P-loop ATPase, Sll1717 family n=1 Tax=unclassified Aeromonas TaxID=257493 RepID=UPI003527599F